MSMKPILTAEQLTTLWQRRAATRAYDPAKKIPDADFEAILQAGRLSPSSVGSEPWQFLVVQNRELRAQLKPVSWGMATQVDDASHLVVILAKKNARYDSPFFDDIIARRGFTGEAAEAAAALPAKRRKRRAPNTPVSKSTMQTFWPANAACSTGRASKLISPWPT